jgi:hypothetical protein
MRLNNEHEVLHLRSPLTSFRISNWGLVGPYLPNLQKLARFEQQLVRHGVFMSEVEAILKPSRIGALDGSAIG